MLPFLKPKRMAASIAQRIKPNGTLESQSDEKQDRPTDLASKLINAVHAKDAQAVQDVIDAIMGNEVENEE